MARKQRVQLTLDPEVVAQLDKEENMSGLVNEQLKEYYDL